MGLTVHYEWRTKAVLQEARRKILRFHSMAKKLAFDEVSDVFELSPPGKRRFKAYKGFPPGSLYLPRIRSDGRDEVVHVPATHSMFFFVWVKGAESAPVGLASHPPVVVHREDIVEIDRKGVERGRRIEAGSAVEFPTRRRGCYSWQSFCKTQYASDPRLGGEPNFLKAHLLLIEFLDQIHATGVKVRIRDDSGYARHRNVNRLLKSIRRWDAIIAGFAGKLSDSLGSKGHSIIAPIKERPDFEHLEAKGADLLRKLATRQKRRRSQ